MPSVNAVIRTSPTGAAGLPSGAMEQAPLPPDLPIADVVFVAELVDELVFVAEPVAVDELVSGGGTAASTAGCSAVHAVPQSMPCTSAGSGMSHSGTAESVPAFVVGTEAAGSGAVVLATNLMSSPSRAPTTVISYVNFVLRGTLQSHIWMAFTVTTPLPVFVRYHVAFEV